MQNLFQPFDMAGYAIPNYDNARQLRLDEFWDGERPIFNM